jgi:hypothetical protein
VHESSDGRTVWKGDVEVFALYDHPLASKAFAWGLPDKNGKMQFVVILNEGSVLTPRDAVLNSLPPDNSMS